MESHENDRCRVLDLAYALVLFVGSLASGIGGKLWGYLRFFPDLNNKKPLFIVLFTTYSLKRFMTDNDITYQIRGAIYDVYKNLGPGLLESVYEEAMSYELGKRGLAVERQLEIPIHYDGHLLNASLRLDLLVQKRIVVELKSVKELQEVHFMQTRTYLKLLDLKVGILVNFNTNDILKNGMFRVVNGV